ncbi:MAG TPA: sigma-70 family RNA polymerase sigma factor [Thermoanaerobaculia bacterium]
MILDPRARAELQRDLTRLADGDREAFEGVFTHLWPVVRSLAARYLPPPDVDDAAQGALLKLFERAGEFDPARDAVAWAIGLAMWEIRTVRRRWWRRRDTGTLDDATELPLHAATPEERAIAADLAAAVDQTLATLRPEDRDALLRYALDERTIGAGFRKRLQRARERMRAAWRLNHE